MKRFVLIVFLIFSLSFFSSCLQTLYPIFHIKDTVFSESLLGYWKSLDKAKNVGFIEFKRIPEDRESELPPGIREISDKGYFVSKIDSMGKIRSQYFVFLARIGKCNYLDYYPAEMPSQRKVNKLYRDHYIKLHESYRFDFKDNDHFEIRLFDQAFLEKLLSDNKINIQYEVVNGRKLITASTDDLQQFVIKYSDNPDAYGGDITYCIRIRDY
ncbi:MAG TPA: hypothetical protein VK166_17865 [Chitinophagaceae bacterium]|nr:hypothetical protein [Chitinophagaceae bacterium]